MTEFASEDPTVMAKGLDWYPPPLIPENDEYAVTDDEFLAWETTGRKGVQ